MGFIQITRETPDGFETWDWDSAPESIKEELAFEVDLKINNLRISQE